MAVPRGGGGPSRTVYAPLSSLGHAFCLAPVELSFVVARVESLIARTGRRAAAMECCPLPAEVESGKGLTPNVCWDRQH